MKKTIYMLLIATLIIAAVTDAASMSVCEHFVRFRIIADSNSPYDQIVKMKLRDFVFEKFGNELENCKAKEDTLRFLAGNAVDIETLANSYLSDMGYPKKARVYVENAWFPKKDYGEFVLPGGEYDSFKIIIGEGKGKNFFCVMFPPACISKEMTGKVNRLLSDGKIEYKLKIFSKE